MAGRGFRVTVHLDVHAITCPGVWLCPHGKVALRISSLGRTVESRRIPPIFPLLLHERFIFEKVLLDTLSLSMLEKNLSKEQLFAELVQCLGPHKQGIVVLASFRRNLIDLLYPMPCCKRLLPGVNVDLLMEPTTYFPGIIVPKIEISTNTLIEEVAAILKTRNSQDCIIKPKMMVPKIPNPKRNGVLERARTANGIIRQKRVCHSKESSNLQQHVRRESSKLLNNECCCTMGLSCPICSKYNYFFETRPRKADNGYCLEEILNSKARLRPKYAQPQAFPCECSATMAYINAHDAFQDDHINGRHKNHLSK